MEYNLPSLGRGLHSQGNIPTEDTYRLLLTLSSFLGQLVQAGESRPGQVKSPIPVRICFYSLGAGDEAEGTGDTCTDAPL